MDEMVAVADAGDFKRQEMGGSERAEKIMGREAAADRYPVP